MAIGPSTRIRCGYFPYFPLFMYFLHFHYFPHVIPARTDHCESPHLLRGCAGFQYSSLADFQPVTTSASPMTNQTTNQDRRPPPPPPRRRRHPCYGGAAAAAAPLLRGSRGGGSVSTIATRAAFQLFSFSAFALFKYWKATQLSSCRVSSVWGTQGGIFPRAARAETLIFLWFYKGFQLPRSSGVIFPGRCARRMRHLHSCLRFYKERTYAF